MKASADRFRDPALAQALDAALTGGAAARAPLYDRLRRVSGLPGPRINVALVRAFAGEVAHRGAAADALLAAMRAVHDDVAPFGHVDEILTVLGVAGTGARAASDAKVRNKLLVALEDPACDVRSRVRDEVSNALVSAGIAAPEEMTPTLRRWIDDEQPYLGRAVVGALADSDLMSTLGGESVTELLEAALERVSREHRGGRRHDGYRRLVRALETTMPLAVARFTQTAAMAERQAANEDEDVRSVIEATAASLDKGRARDRAATLLAALQAAKKPSRDPRWDRLPGKRGRGR